MRDSERVLLDLKNKLKYEKRLARKVKRLFNRIAADFQKQIEGYATSVDTSKWGHEFSKVYLDHYKDVAKVFSKALQTQLNLPATDEQKQIIEAALLIYFMKLANESAAEATKTTRKNANEAIFVANEQRAEDTANGITHTQATIAAIAAYALRKKLRGRVNGIATTETQKAAETSKRAECEVLSSDRTSINNPNEVIPTTGRKDWYGILDKRIRQTHLTADRTQKGIPISEPFRVGASIMMYPGDTSLGASMKEIMNCRCTCIYNPNKAFILAKYENAS